MLDEKVVVKWSVCTSEPRVEGSNPSRRDLNLLRVIIYRLFELPLISEMIDQPENKRQNYRK